MPVPKTVKPKTMEQLTDQVDQEVPDDEPIELGYVPEPINGVSYVSRDVYGMQDLELLDYAEERAKNILLYGPTGPGKTSLSLAWAASRNRRFYSVSSNIGIDPGQLFGRWGPDGKGGFRWYDGGVTNIVRHGGLLLINEVNFLPDRIATVVFSLLDKRREIMLLDHKAERIRAHRPNCWCSLPAKVCRKMWVLVVADMNPGYEGTRDLNKALRNRFPIQIEWDYDRDVEEKLVISKTLLDIAYNIRKRAEDDVPTPVSTNMLQEFEEHVRDKNIDFAIGNFVAHFAPDERSAVAGAIDAQKDKLEDDYAPSDSDYDEFSEAGAKWMIGPAPQPTRPMLDDDDELDFDDDADDDEPFPFSL